MHPSFLFQTLVGDVVVVFVIVVVVVVKWFVGAASAAVKRVEAPPFDDEADAEASLLPNFCFLESLVNFVDEDVVDIVTVVVVVVGDIVVIVLP